MHLLSNLKIIRLIYYLTTIFYLVQEFYFESMIYTLKLVFFFCIFLECCQQKAGDYMLATTKIIRLFAKKGEIQTIPAKNVLPFFRIGSWALHTCVVAVLWCQPIKLIHVLSTSEFHEYYNIE